MRFTHYKIQCGWASQDSSLPAFGEESTPSFQGDPKSSVSYLRCLVVLVARRRREKSKRGVQSRAFFCVQETLRSLESCKIPYIQRSQVWRETWWMRSLLFRVRDQATSVLALTFLEEKGNMSWDKTDKKKSIQNKKCQDLNDSCLLEQSITLYIIFSEFRKKWIFAPKTFYGKKRDITIG